MTFPFFGGFALAVGCGSAQRVADFLFDVLFEIRCQSLKCIKRHENGRFAAQR